MTECTDCNDEIDSDWYMCIGGVVYGPCTSEWCGGVCEAAYSCDCECHK